MSDQCHPAAAFLSICRCGLILDSVHRDATRFMEIASEVPVRKRAVPKRREILPSGLKKPEDP